MRRLWQWLAQPAHALLVLLPLVVFPLYYQLGQNPVQLWDESRLAVNAAEMAHGGHWLVPTFGGHPDHWNTKPPLLIWLEALSIRYLGFSTWALRLPTLLATLATAGLLFRFASRVLRRPLAGFFGVAILVTCGGYLRLHVARTADYDALLTGWQVLLWTRFFEYLETGTCRHLAWAALAVVAATLTKGPAGLLGLPGLLTYTVGRGRLGWLLRQPGVYLAAAGWLAVVGGYLLLRESLDPGYWQAVRANDLGGRFLTAIQGHGSTWPFYLESIKNHTFDKWLWALAPTGLLLALQPAGVVRRAAGLLLAFVVGWLVVVTLAKTKLTWYDAPIYPALALLVGLGLSILCQDVLATYGPRLGRAGRRALGAGLFITLFYGSYHAVVRQFVEERTSPFVITPDDHLGRYLPELARARPALPHAIFLTRGNSGPALKYYQLQFAQAFGQHLAVVPGTAARRLPVGTVVVLCDSTYRAALDATFQVVVLHQDAPCQTLLLRPRLR